MPRPARASLTSLRPGTRIGAVSYLNSRPLVCALEELAPTARVVYDLPSRLADQLAAGTLDVALVPSIEYARRPDYTIVSDACVSSDGAVRSVMLYSRVPMDRIASLALDEGSRTSAALCRILLAERFRLHPRIEPLPIGASLEDSTADATLVIGDRGMKPVGTEFAAVWDLGREWREWTGLPFVFAMWIARRHGELRPLAKLLSAGRTVGVRRVRRLAEQAAVELELSFEDCLAYLTKNLSFRIGQRQWRGLARFFDLAARHGLAPAGADRVLRV